VFQLAPGEPVGRCGSGPVCLRVGKQTRSFQRAGAQAAPLTVGRRQPGTNGGTYAHPILACAYAGYLSPELEIEVREIWLRYRAGDATLADEVLARASP